MLLTALTTLPQLLGPWHVIFLLLPALHLVLLTIMLLVLVVIEVL
jgi:hypothetical protein